MKAEVKAPGLRQSMSGLHTWAGLLAGWLLYAMFLTGTVSYFRNEISQWMRPEIPARSNTNGAWDAAQIAQRTVNTLSTQAAGSAQWVVYLPDARSNVVNANWRMPPSADTPQRRSGEGLFNPTTGRMVNARSTQGGDFFYHFHYQFHYLPIQWGRWLAGICAMFMLVAIISGVIVHRKIFADFFTFRANKGQRSWLDAHNGLSVLGLPFHLMITFSGLVILMAMYLPWGEKAGVKTPQQREQMADALHAYIQPGKRSGEATALTDVGALVQQAEQRWGTGTVSRIIINHPGDAAARVSLLRGEVQRVSFSPQFMTFDGANGTLIKVQDSVGAAAETRGVLYALHLGRFGDFTLRWFYFVVSLAGSAMVETGLVLWTVKRRQRLEKHPQPHNGLWLVEHGNVAAIAGLSMAMAAYLCANRLLPTDWPDRANAEIACFFIVWGMALLHALVRPVKQAWTEQWGLAAALLWALPVINAWSTSRGWMASVRQGDTVFWGFDLMCCLMAALHTTLALKARSRGSHVKSEVSTHRRDGTAERKALT